MKKSLFFLLIPSLLFSSPYGGTLYLSTISDPKSFNGIISKESSTSDAIGFLFEGLTDRDGVTTEIEPCLAKSWDYSKDGKVWRFYLREDVKWFDGKPFTADDVVFTYNSLIYNDDIPTSSRDVLTIDGQKLLVEKVSTYTVQFTLPKPFAPLLHQLGQAIFPKHILEKAVKEKRFLSTWGVDTSPQKIIGTGPFIMTEYKPSERIVYKRNPNYWKKDKKGNSLPYIEKIVKFIVSDQQAQLASFEAKETDILSVMGKDYAYLKNKEAKGRFTLVNYGSGFGSNFLSFNQNRFALKQPKIAWFSDLSFRKAVAHAIDKEAIIKNVMLGFGFPQSSAMEEAAKFFYNGSVAKYEYNLEKAKKILEKAGYIDRNKDGIREDKKGNPIKFTLITNAENLGRRDMGVIISEDLRKIGLDVGFAPIDFNKLVNILTVSQDWDAMLIGLTGGIEPHSGKNVWETTGELHFWNQEPKDNEKKKVWQEGLSLWEKEIDAIFNKGAAELNEKKRKALYDKWQVIVSEQLPLIYTVNPATLYAIRDKFIGMKPTAYGGCLHNLEEISIKPEWR
ncbi:MAG: ABC transporter substrate-binding protein [bacterium]|nr:ABC transporter substrate-binding protein [bacterium]